MTQYHKSIQNYKKSKFKKVNAKKDWKKVFSYKKSSFNAISF